MAWLESARAPEIGMMAERGPVLIGVQARLLFRYVGVGALCVASLMFYVWSRVDVQHTTAALDGSYAQLYKLEVEAERLGLELATRRDVGRLQAASADLGLTAPARVVSVRVGAEVQ